MPLREYRCQNGHKIEKLVYGEPAAEIPCTECIVSLEAAPMFAPDPQPARLVEFSSTFSPSDDFKLAEARARYKAGAEPAGGSL